MKAISDEGDIKEIRLRHKGKDLNFRNVSLNPYTGEIVQENTRLFLEFDDITEVDALIEILIRFRRQSDDVIGKWKLESATNRDLQERRERLKRLVEGERRWRD